ncbi:MAG: RdgB/HAM1 family non-canonical purine NTP pyrophosphatase [Phycisphaerales bacterium]|nr:RdgB/HAM1 family non-canonical purine NTP pyrophosphatase [Phycisphaerales bacterium]
MSESEPRPRVILIATGNPHKLEEFKAMLGPLGIQCRGLRELAQSMEEPAENGGSFSANARIKARAYARATGMWALADDSGLEVDALGGEPGVDSAIWAGEAGTRSERDRRNNEKLVAAMGRVPLQQRAARFVCCVCLVDPHGELRFECRGELAGEIVEVPRGSNGFGYDPHLYLAQCGCTSAELSAAEKNSRSHRGNAVRQLVKWLEAGG